MPKKNSKFLFLALSLCMIIYSGCSSVAVTGRKQLNLVSNAEIVPLAAKEYQEVVKKGPLSTDAAKTALIKKVGLNIQHAVEKYMADNGRSAELNDFSWEYNLIQDDSTVNAWCMPGGKVAFYTAILPICKDETGIAVVMGHEVAHAIANHGRERMSQSMVKELGIKTLGMAVGSNAGATSQLLMQAVGMGSELGMLKFSRSHESEADHMGIIFMAMAGYDPNQAPYFWERMAAASGAGQKPHEFLSTHPSDETRIKDLKGWIPEAMGYYKK